MAKASAVVLSSGGLHSLVIAGLASREYRVGMLHLRDGRPSATQAAAAFDRQVAQIKPLKSWFVDAAYLRQMAMPPETAGMVNSTGSDSLSALIPMRELQFLTVAAGLNCARQITAVDHFLGRANRTTRRRRSGQKRQFLQVMNQLLELMTPESPIAIKTPPHGPGRSPGHRAGLPDGPPLLSLTWSCQMPQSESPCMSCPACAPPHPRASGPPSSPIRWSPKNKLES